MLEHMLTKIFDNESISIEEHKKIQAQINSYEGQIVDYRTGIHAQSKRLSQEEPTAKERHSLKKLAPYDKYDADLQVEYEDVQFREQQAEELGDLKFEHIDLKLGREGSH